MNGDGAQNHSLYIHDCRRAELTGIREVENFNETGIDLLSAGGAVAIEGEELKIDNFSVESGKITITGRITGVFYYEKPDKSGAKRSGLFARRTK